ncbi:RCC1 domain-containing protein [Paenibacillus sp. GYB003]|uniref:RCC1 domain-containing protein n=1 Tax=Paenibacillus sp. GYB003 TaxID=2994392 RepID=UPI002F964A9D
MWKRKAGLIAFAALLAGSPSVHAAESKPVNAEPKITAGYQYSIQVEEDGTVWSFGKQLGSMFASQVGRQSGGVLDHVVQAGGGYAHAAAVDDEGRVWAWGENDKGQLGQGDIEPYAAAVQVPFEGGTRIEAVAVGYDHTLALSEKGNVWAWGGNRYGQLGDGTETDRSKPVRVMDGLRPMRDAVAVAAGFGYSLALNEDGEVWTWGSQGKADGDVRQVMLNKGGRLIPLNDIVAISAGYDHSIALDRSGKLYVWGVNRDGQLGLGSGTLYSLDAVELTGLPAMKAIAAGERSSAAVDETGNLWVWGVGVAGPSKNASGETVRFEPERITDGGHFATVSVGRDHGVATDDEERIWVWGRNDNGQLGHGYRSFATSKPVVKNELQREYASASFSTVAVEETFVRDNQYVVKLNLQLKDAAGKMLYGKWPTAEWKMNGREPTVAAFALAKEGGYRAEIGIPYPYYIIPQKIEVRVDGTTIAELTIEKH